MVQLKKAKKQPSWKEYLKEIDTPALKATRKFSFWLFAVFYVLLIAALMVVGIKFIQYCEDSFILYENSQLSLAVDQAMERINSASAKELRQLLVAPLPEASEFDDAEAAIAEQYERLAQTELSCKELRGYDAESHSYGLFADEVEVGKFTIEARGEETRLTLLTITDWQFAGGEAYFQYDSIQRSYTVPEGFKVCVNGIELGEEHTDGEIKKISAFKYFEEYADLPGMITYTVSGLLHEPRTEIFDNLGAPVDFDTQAQTVVLPERYASCDVPDELSEEIVRIAQLWANYSLSDATLRDVNTVLIPDSLFYQQVQDSDRDRRFINPHTLQGYKNVQLSEYTSFTDNCFSCRVYMERTVKLTTNQSLREDMVDNIFYFVWLDLSNDGVDNGQWYIADMISAS